MYCVVSQVGQMMFYFFFNTGVVCTSDVQFYGSRNVMLSIDRANIWVHLSEVHMRKAYLPEVHYS